MKVVEGRLNSGRLLQVLKDGLGKEDMYRPNLKCLLGRTALQDSDRISAPDRNQSVRFLLRLCRHCSFNPETFALAVNVLDRLLSIVKSQPKYLTCISIGCLFIAVKMVEEDENVPTASDFIQVSGVSCSCSDLLRMERIVLDKLGWNLNPATPLYFLQVFHALCVSEGFLEHCSVAHHLHHVTQKLEELLCHHSFTFFEPSTLALGLLTYELGFISKQWISAAQYLQKESKEKDDCDLAMQTQALEDAEAAERKRKDNEYARLLQERRDLIAKQKREAQEEEDRRLAEQIAFRDAQRHGLVRPNTRQLPRPIGYNPNVISRGPPVDRPFHGNGTDVTDAGEFTSFSGLGGCFRTSCAGSDDVIDASKLAPGCSGDIRVQE